LPSDPQGPSKESNLLDRERREGCLSSVRRKGEDDKEDIHSQNRGFIKQRVGSKNLGVEEKGREERGLTGCQKKPKVIGENCRSQRRGDKLRDIGRGRKELAYVKKERPRARSGWPIYGKMWAAGEKSLQQEGCLVRKEGRRDSIRHYSIHGINGYPKKGRN